jgi:EAL domain-containing protein (putative c-di-GMP-specific phosphodiesterase class I)/DNA-binding response OmpR family regulator
MDTSHAKGRGPAVNDSGQPASASVLVVDDDAAIRQLVAISLRNAGLRVVVADNGRSALDIIEAESVGVIVCDVQMPGLSGIEVVQELRRRPGTSTLPVILMTGSGDEYSVVKGLEAGATDFLSKPVRLDELVARVRAHLRTHAAWSSILQDELALRSGVVAALGSLTLSAVPEETAAAIVTEISRRTGSAFVSVAQVVNDQHMQELATFNVRDGIRRSGESFSPTLTGYLLGRARTGPWVEEVTPVGPAVPTAALQHADLELVASAPIFAGNALVGLLSIGSVADANRSSRDQSARLLASAIDYASVLTAIAGPSIAGLQEMDAQRDRLQAILDRREFHSVFQPIVTVDSREVVGFEALTRFADGTRPDLRFAEATRAELGPAYELAAISVALEGLDRLPPGFLSINVSPRTLIDRSDELRSILSGTAGRTTIVELTEHVMIEDYGTLRAALGSLGDDVLVAVDDAGAGFASMRHILELRPSFAKLDMSLVRGIDQDDLRQGLAAGLNYFSLRTRFRLIAEGVETQAEADTLQRLGIELAQGYLYGRPERLAAAS